MNSVFVIAFYSLATVLSLQIVSFSKKRLYKFNNSISDQPQNGSVKLSVIGLLAVDFLFVACNFISTRFKPVFTGDRRIYELDFNGIRISPSIGLDAIIRFIKIFTDNSEHLFYVSTFIVLLISIIAFNLSNDSSTLSYLFLFASQYVFNAFTVLKQSYTNAFAALCIICFLEATHNKKYYIIGIASIFLGTLFHPTSYFLIPLCLVLFFRKTKKSIFLYSFIITVAFFFLDDISLYIARVISPVLPIVSTKIYQYLGETSIELSTERFTFVKGFPYYVITVLGFIYRPRLKDKINNYDNYLLLSVLLSFCYITTVYNGWLYRFSYFFYLPVGIFFSLLLKNVKNRNNRIIIGAVVIGSMLVLTFRFVVLMFVNYGGF